MYREKYELYRKYVDFIKDYRNASNAATGSKVDSNANVEHKNITTCSGELTKMVKIGTNRLLMIDKLTELYGVDIAEEYIRQLETHEKYKHDETSISPYTYGSNEVVNVKYKNHTYTVSFERLYELCDEDEVLLDDEKGVWGKYPHNMQIEDKNGFTTVTRLIKKKRHRGLVRVKTAFSNDIIVTDNHPMIICDDIENTIPASNSMGFKQYRCSSKMEFGVTEYINTKEIIEIGKMPYDVIPHGYLAHTGNNSKWYSYPNKIQVDREMGYFVGFFIGDGDYNLSSSSIGITQKTKDVLLTLADTLYTHFNTASYIHYSIKDEKYRLVCSDPIVFLFLRDILGIKPKAYYKTLPETVFEYKKDFAVGLIEGIIDSDGTIDGAGSYSIRLSSRTACLQIAQIINALGITTGMSTQQTKFGCNEKVTQKYQLFGVRFREPEIPMFTKASKSSKAIPITKGQKGGFDEWQTISNVDNIDNEPYLNLNEYIYDITTETHSFVCNGLWVHNCVSITMYPFLVNGLKEIGGISSSPTNLDAFCGSFINLVFAVAAQFAGAVSTPEFLMYMDYFIRKDYGENYIEHLDDIVTPAFALRQRTLKQIIEDHFQQVVYSLNQPAAARDYQSVFWNIAYFDKPYFKEMFSDFIFPDGAEPNWESTNWLQKNFMEWFNNERTKKALTFPVETVNLLNNDKGYVDEEWADFVAEMYSKGHSFFTYRSDSVDSLSSCCFSGEQKCLSKSSDGVNFMSFKELHDSSYHDSKRNLTIFHNGSWVKGKVIKLPKRKMYKITTSNKKTVIVTDNHIFPTLEGDKQVFNLTTNDYLMFNCRQLDTFPEKDLKLTYEQGYLIGMYLGDGSMNNENQENVSPTICLSLNVDKHNKSLEILNKAISSIDDECEYKLGKPYNNVYPTRAISKKVHDFIREWVSGKYCYEKELNMNCLLQSVEFRKGILDGYYLTDGGNANRIYTTSENLVYQIETLITSLGMNSIIDVTDRTDEPVIIRNEAYKRNYPLYCIRWYTPMNKRTSNNGNFKVVNNCEYYKIASIEPYNYENDNVYCFEMENKDEPYFTLPNGIITHNCRLRNEVQDNTFSFTLGAGGVATGSKGVITTNINRLVQNAVAEGKDISEKMREETLKNHKYLTAYNEIVKDSFKSNMLSIYSAGFIDMDKQYLTQGINGFVEGAEFLGIDISPNEEYFEYGEKILKPIFEENKKAKTKELMFNTEFVPKICGNIAA